MSSPALRENFKKLLAFAIAVLLIVLYFTIDLDTMKRWVKGPEIQVTSTDRGFVEEFLAGEKLRLVLKDIQSPKVVWLFDEATAVIGDVEIEYIFPFREDLPRAQARDRRIDAFFKARDDYEVATALVRTRNVKYLSKAEIRTRVVELAAEAMFDRIWSLHGVSLGKYERGAFTKAVKLPMSGTKQGLQIFEINQAAAKEALGAKEAPHPDWKAALATSTDIWVSYSFIETGTKKKLTVVTPLFREKPE